ncbi:MAG TPA: carboxypeptidase-like regulatory domain-containing protein [Thermoanaerobaculia bacterium]
MSLKSQEMAPFRRFLIALCLLLPFAGCDETPTSVDRRDARLAVSCRPSGVHVTCTATLLDVPNSGSVRDVTSRATWRASDPSVGDFLEPGVFTPRRRGEAELTARFEQWEPLDYLRPWFLVDPQQPARLLYWVAGVIRDEVSNEVLPGVTVEILNGYGRGAQAVTNEYGHYQINRLLTGETISLRASRPGYAPATTSHRVDEPYGSSPGNPPFVDFRLRRLP